MTVAKLVHPPAALLEIVFVKPRGASELRVAVGRDGNRVEIAID
jgi:hypothetical protein